MQTSALLQLSTRPPPVCMLNTCKAVGGNPQPLRSDHAPGPWPLARITHGFVRAAHVEARPTLGQAK